MPYEKHPALSIPPDDTVVWRYFDFPKLLSLLEQKSLYFSLTEEFSDRWEGAISERRQQMLRKRLNEDKLKEFLKYHRRSHEIHGINCWHIGSCESIAMWALYTTPEYGTAIKSTVGCLKESLQGFQKPINIGAVKYVDYEVTDCKITGQDNPNLLIPFFEKRNCYEHEHELRAITLIPPSPETHPPRKGIPVNVDIENLIDSIILCPKFPSWCRTLLESALQRAAIQPSVLKSTLNDPPAQLNSI